MSLRISAKAEDVAKSIARALRDAMDDPQFRTISFYHYISDVNDEDWGMNERVMIINRPDPDSDIDAIAREKAETLVSVEFTDKSVQDYEAVVCTVEGEDADGEEYDMTEQIIGDGDGMEWEIEYLPDLPKPRQFKVVGYLNDKDFSRKLNGEVYTDIETLLKRINRARYYKDGKEVRFDEDWYVRYNHTFELFDDGIKHWVIEEQPTDTSIKIVGVDIWLAIPQRNNAYTYDSLLDPRLAGVSEQRMSLYPYTMKEFLRVLSDPVTVERYGKKVQQILPYDKYDFIALLHS